MEGSAEGYQRLLPGQGRLFEEFFALYSGSMPQRELKARDQIEAMLHRPDYEFLLVTSDRGVIGYSVSYLAEGEPCSLLEYMAIHGASQSTGVGGRLLAKLIERAEARGSPWMLMEVASERDGAQDGPARSRREQFYRRHGCLRIDALAYLLPLPGDGPPPAMDLLVHPPEAGGVMRKADLRRWLEALFVGAYGCRSDDRRIAEMLASVEDPVVLV